MKSLNNNYNNKKYNNINNNNYSNNNIYTSTNSLSAATIKHYLYPSITDNVDIQYYDLIDSTNTALKQLAKNGAQEWTILVANEQTSGRGRLGRSFYSPANTGIYLSILLRPDWALNCALYLTTCAAVIVADAISSVLDVNTGIKWVNDIYIDDKKVAGILAESSMNYSHNTLDYVVLGIGINVYPPENHFPEDIKNIATSLLKEQNVTNNIEVSHFKNINDTNNIKASHFKNINDTNNIKASHLKNINDTNNIKASHLKNTNDTNNIRSKLVSSIINNLWNMYPQVPKKHFHDRYKELSIILNQPVYILNGDSKEEAFAVDIDDEFNLIVKKNDGTLASISYGEVSVRKIGHK